MPFDAAAPTLAIVGNSFDWACPPVPSTPWLVVVAGMHAIDARFYLAGTGNEKWCAMGCAPLLFLKMFGVYLYTGAVVG